MQTVQASHTQRTIAGVVVHEYVGAWRIPEALRTMDTEGGPTWPPLREGWQHGAPYTCKRCGQTHLRGEHNLCTCDACAAAATLRMWFERSEEATTYSFRNKAMSKEDRERAEEAKYEQEAAKAYLEDDHSDAKKNAYRRTLRNLYLLARKTPQDRLQQLLKALRREVAHYTAMADTASERGLEGVDRQQQAKALAEAYALAADMVWARTRQHKDVPARRRHKDKPHFARTLDVATFYESGCSCGYGWWG